MREFYVWHTLEHTNVCSFIGVWLEDSKINPFQTSGLVSPWIPFDTMDFLAPRPEKTLDVVSLLSHI